MGRMNVFIVAVVVGLAGMATALFAAESNDAKVDNFLNQSATLCEQIAQSSPVDYDAELSLIKGKLVAELTRLGTSIGATTNAANAQGWKKFLQFEQLNDALKNEPVNVGALEKALVAFNSKEPGLEKPIFAPTRQLLEQFIREQAKSTERDNEADGEYLREICGKIPEVLGRLTSQYDADDAESIASYLNDITDIRPKTSAVDQLKHLISDFYGGPNLLVSIGANGFANQTIRKIEEPITVSEFIRGANVRGTGLVKGNVTLEFIPNSNIAEMGIKANTTVTTQTTAYRDGARVYSNNTGSLVARKSFQFDKHLTSTPARATGTMQSQVSGVDSGRGWIGQNIAEQRVVEEKPYSTAESTRKMEKRLADRLDTDMNMQIAKANAELIKRVYDPLKNAEFEPRSIQSRTTADRFYWSAIVGTPGQIGIQRIESSQMAQTQVCDLGVMVHESGLNNASFHFFAGKRIDQQEVSDELHRLFPELEPKVDDADQSNKNEAADLIYFFAEELPVTTTFANDSIVVKMRVDGFEKEGREYPGLDITIEYKIISQNGFLLRREKIEVLPADYEVGQVIPARYQAIRSIVMGQLNDQLPAERHIDSIPVEAEENAAFIFPAGTLEPARITTDAGWLIVDYQFVRK